MGFYLHTIQKKWDYDYARMVEHAIEQFEQKLMLNAEDFHQHKKGIENFNNWDGSLI